MLRSWCRLKQNWISWKPSPPLKYLGCSPQEILWHGVGKLTRRTQQAAVCQRPHFLLLRVSLPFSVTLCGCCRRCLHFDGLFLRRVSKSKIRKGELCPNYLACKLLQKYRDLLKEAAWWSRHAFFDTAFAFALGEDYHGSDQARCESSRIYGHLLLNKYSHRRRLTAASASLQRAHRSTL